MTRIAVVIPTHGPSLYLAEAASSVEGADEVVVVEDGTTGADERELAGARLLRLPRVGRARARNAGVEAVDAGYVAFLDSDDVALPDRLERQRSALDGDAGAVLTFGEVMIGDASFRPLEQWNSLLRRRRERLIAGGVTYEAILASRCPIYTSGTMVRREAFLDVGGYDERFDAYEDLDLYLRLARRGRVVPTPGGPVALYRVHGQNTASERLFAGALAVAEKHLPSARGRERRLLLQRKVEALWGLGRYGDVRREAARAVLRDPLVVADVGFVRRAAGSFVR